MALFDIFKKIMNPFLILISMVLILVYLIHTIPIIQSTFSETYKDYKVRFFDVLPKVIIVIIIFLLTKLFIKLTLSKIESALEKKGRKQDILLFGHPYRFFVWFIAILVSLSIVFKNFATLIASLGLIGFGITFALQKPILNFVGWLTILTKRPYWIGDRVMIGSVKGDVYDMNIMYTSLSEFSFSGDEPAGRSITIPNENVLTQPVINYTRGSSSIWDVIEMNITYDSDWREASKLMEDSAIEVVGKIMKDNAEHWRQHKQKFTILGKDILDKPITRVEFTENYIKVRCHYIVEARKRGITKSSIIEKILDNIKSTKKIKISTNNAFK